MSGQLRAVLVMVKVPQHPQLGTVMHLLVKLMKHQGSLIVLGIRPSDRTRRLAPRIWAKRMQQVMPEIVRVSQHSLGLCGSRWCRVLDVKLAGWPVQSLRCTPSQPPTPS
jgi:hypothetical protein